MKEHLFKFWILELREIFRESKEFCLFLRFVDWIEFSGIFYSYFFSPREFDKTLRLPNLEYRTFTQRQSILHNQECSTFCSL